MGRGADPLALVLGLVAAASGDAGTPEQRNEAIVDLLGAAVPSRVGLLLALDLHHRDVDARGRSVTPAVGASLRHRLRTGELPGPLLCRVAAGELGPSTAARAYGGGWERSLLREDCRRNWACDQLAVLPVAGGARPVVYLLGRSGPDFDDAELSLLAAVQPAVQGLVRLLRLDGVAWDPAAGDAGSRRPGRLTARESEVLALLARGHKAATIARMVGCSERTVHRHLSNLYAKLGVGDRLSAVSVAHRRGLLAAGAGTG